MTTQNTFSHYFQHQALIERLPFKIDFKISQVDSEVKKSVAGLEFSIVNDLVSRESWFFNVIESLNSDKIKTAQLMMRQLTMGVADCLNIDYSEAYEVLWEGAGDYANNAEYVTFYQENTGKIEELIELLTLAQDNQALNWLRVTFFILSRCTPDWSLSDTVGLTDSQIKDIIDLITLEANQGVMPEPKSTVEPVANETEDEGKTTD